jgi:hypothetical protein
VIKAAPKIKPMQERARKPIIDANVEGQLLPFSKQPLRDVLMIMRLRNAEPEGSVPDALVAYGLDEQSIFVHESKPQRDVRKGRLARYSNQKEGWVFPSKRVRCEHLTP